VPVAKVSKRDGVNTLTLAHFLFNVNPKAAR